MPEPEPTIQFSGDHGRTWHHAEGRLDAHFETLAREYPARTIRTDCSHTIEFTVPADQADRFWEMFHGIPGWLYDAWTCDRTRPVSRGTAWRDGTYAACQHHLTGPPEPPRPQFPSWQTAVYPRWYIAWVIEQMRRAYAEHPELFDPRAWTTGDWDTDLTARQLAEQHPAALHLYDQNWRIATEPGAAVHALPRTVARDYPAPAEPCAECARIADPWQAILRHVGIFRIDRDALLGPRTDFMPRYPK